jgi:hypothetical protein
MHPILEGSRCVKFLQEQPMTEFCPRGCGVRSLKASTRNDQDPLLKSELIKNGSSQSDWLLLAIINQSVPWQANRAPMQVSLQTLPVSLPCSVIDLTPLYTFWTGFTLQFLHVQYLTRTYVDPAHPAARISRILPGKLTCKPCGRF